MHLKPRIGQQFYPTSGPAPHYPPRKPLPRTLHAPQLWALLHRRSAIAQPATQAAIWMEAFTAALKAGDCPCIEDWSAMLRATPMPADSAAARCWAVDRHNQVNLRIGKPFVSYEEAAQIWGWNLPMRRAVIIGNWFGDGMRPNSRASIQAAAARWGVEYQEIKSGLSGRRDGFAEKLHIDLHASAFDQVLYLDRDVVIRSDCPSPFDLVPLDSFGAVPSCQPGHDWRGVANLHLKPCFDRAGVLFDPGRDHFNGGFYLFSPSVHFPVFAAARELATREHDRHWAVYEEGLVSLAMKQSGLPIVRLDKEFNRCGGPSREEWEPPMHAFIQHYCGDHQRRDERMDKTVWDLDAPEPSSSPDEARQTL